MAKVKHSELENILLGLKLLVDTDLPFSASLKIRDIHRAVTTKFEDVQAVRAELVEKFALRDADGKMVSGEEVAGQSTVKLDPEKLEQAKLEINGLMESEYDVPVTLNKGDFGDAKVAPRALILLGAVVEA